jgi:hypothetical protein
VVVTEIPEKRTYQEERFILAHDFRVCSPWSLSFIFLAIFVAKLVHLMIARKERERQRERERERERKRERECARTNQLASFFFLS